MSYHKTLTDQNTSLRRLLPLIHCLSQVLYTLSWGEWCFSSLCPWEGQSGLTQRTLWFSALGQYLPSLCLWAQWGFIYAAPSLLSLFFFFPSVQRVHLTLKILELRSGMLRRQAPSVSLQGNSLWGNPSYLVFQPRACRHLHLSCIPLAPQTLESREENRHFRGAIHLSLM